MSRQPLRRSTNSRYSKTPRNALRRSCSTLGLTPFVAMKSSALRRNAFSVSSARVSRLSSWPGLPRSAPTRAALSCSTRTKSLKWPACSEASWRLSLKASSLRALSGISASGKLSSWRSTARLKVVVAELRPSEFRPQSLRNSLPRTLCSTPQLGQKRKLPLRNQAGVPSLLVPPSALIRQGTGANSR